MILVNGGRKTGEPVAARNGRRQFARQGEAGGGGAGRRKDLCGWASGASSLPPYRRSERSASLVTSNRPLIRFRFAYA